MTQKIYQRMTEGLRKNIKAVFGVADRNGMITACSDETQIGRILPDFHMQNGISKDYVSVQIRSGTPGNDYVFLKDTGQNALQTVSMLAGFFEVVLQGESENSSQQAFLFSAMEYGTEGSDFYGQLTKLNINNKIPHVVILFSSGTAASQLYDVINADFMDHHTDFVYSTKENNILLVKQTDETDNRIIAREIHEKLRQIKSDRNLDICAGISPVILDLVELPYARRAAEHALESAHAGGSEKNVMASGYTGIPGLIARLNTEDCRSYLDEIWPGYGLDEELMTAAETFLNTGMNISETANRLYINRNTLIYRLNRIQKETGIDLRCFNDAAAFHAALMIRRRLDAEK